MQAAARMVSGGAEGKEGFRWILGKSNGKFSRLIPSTDDLLHPLVAGSGMAALTPLCAMPALPLPGDREHLNPASFRLLFLHLGINWLGKDLLVLCKGVVLPQTLCPEGFRRDLRAN